jgi:hypothetical protein
MKIGIDVSQTAYPGTGVSNFIVNLVNNLAVIDKENEYVLFFSSLRRNFQFSIFNFQSNDTNFKLNNLNYLHYYWMFCGTGCTYFLLSGLSEKWMCS